MASAAGNANGLARLRSLYRQILRTHQAKLPGPLRAIGDSYVKSEFKGHLTGKTTAAQWEEFGKQWTTYVQMLNGQAGESAIPVSTSGDLAPEVLDELSLDQKKRLEHLREETVKAVNSLQEKGQEKNG